MYLNAAKSTRAHNITRSDCYDKRAVKYGVMYSFSLTTTPSPDGGRRTLRGYEYQLGGDECARLLRATMISSTVLSKNRCHIFGNDRLVAISLP